MASRILALAPGGGDLVTGALGDDLALELGEGEKHIQDQPAHRGGGVELLGNGDKGHPVLLEDFDDAGKVQQRAAEAVHLVDHDTIDPAGCDIVQEALEGRPLHVAAREAAVVIAVGQASPAFPALTGDVGLSRFALGIERVELLVEAFFG